MFIVCNHFVFSLFLQIFGHSVGSSQPSSTVSKPWFHCRAHLFIYVRMIMCVQHPHKLPSIYWGYLANIYCRQIWRGRSGKDSRSDTEMALCSRRRYPPICPYRYLRNNKKAMEQWSDGATEKRAQLSCWFLRIWRGRPFPLFFFAIPQLNNSICYDFEWSWYPVGPRWGAESWKITQGILFACRLDSWDIPIFEVSKISAYVWKYIPTFMVHTHEYVSR